MKKVQVVIVSPALADANNGNWQTARRWQRLLAPAYRASIVRDWAAMSPPGDERVMLALHARRSAASIAAWAAAQKASHDVPGLAVVLTGTDLYRDILADPRARNSLALARSLVTLQELGPDALPSAFQAKARVVFQSTSARQPLAKTRHHLRVVMVGHLRDEKAPQTLFQAAHYLRQHSDIRIDHIGAPLDPALGEQALATARHCPGYRWFGEMPHEATRRCIQRAHLLVHTSCMEGGAHVVMEAVRSGTPVLASRIPGNVGMLGAAYAGYFELNDAHALADLLLRCRVEQQQIGAPLMQRLAAQCQGREALFSPASERAALQALVSDLMLPHQTAP